MKSAGFEVVLSARLFSFSAGLRNCGVDTLFRTNIVYSSLVMQFALRVLLGNLGEKFDLLRDVLEHAEHAPVPFDKRHFLVPNPFPFLELLALPPPRLDLDARLGILLRPNFDQRILLLDPMLNLLGHRPEAESRNAREKVMRRLKVETAVEEIEISRARNVHRRSELAVRVRFEQFERGARDRQLVGFAGRGGRED